MPENIALNDIEIETLVSTEYLAAEAGGGTFGTFGTAGCPACFGTFGSGS
ncbi:hypothetical protein ACVLV4_001199 [Rathayibacter agropyri]